MLFTTVDIIFSWGLAPDFIAPKFLKYILPHNELISFLNVFMFKTIFSHLYINPSPPRAPPIFSPPSVHVLIGKGKAFQGESTKSVTSLLSSPWLLLSILHLMRHFCFLKELGSKP